MVFLLESLRDVLSDILTQATLGVVIGQACWRKQLGGKVLIGRASGRDDGRLGCSAKHRGQRCRRLRRS